MRFITEFENDGTKFDDALTDHRKEWRQKELGKLIADTFGWDRKGVTTLTGPVKERFALEIEAFPMDKWMLFKTKLFHRLIQDNIPTKYFDNLIEELESFGKPSGDAKQSNIL